MPGAPAAFFHAQQFPVCIKNRPPPKGRPANLTQLWEAFGVNMGQHPCGTLLTPCKVYARRIEAVHAPVYYLRAINNV